MGTRKFSKSIVRTLYLFYFRFEYSKKGYIDGEIGAEWIKHFDNLTKRRAHGCHCLLLLDGHQSRLTLPFLLHAKENDIHVLCYPSHSTHIYQGLDVVIFSLLKKYFSEEMIKFESSTGTPVYKDNFLQVYSPAHICAFTKANIQAAFAATGIHPFNPDVIPASAFKPAVESSCTGSGLPFPQPSPIKVTSQLLLQGISGAQQASQELSQTSAGFLTSQSPIKSTSQVPYYLPPFNAPSQSFAALLNIVPATEIEEKLLAALDELLRREALQYGALLGLQATVVLQNVYCECIRGQLHAQEKKEGEKKGSGRLMGDGLPRCLTSDEFVQRVHEFTKHQLDEAAAKEWQRLANEGHAEAIADWKKNEASRKKRNEKKKEEWKQQVAIWEAEQDLAKAERCHPCWKKPVLGSLEAPIPRPTRISVQDELEEIEIDEDALGESEEDE